MENGELAYLTETEIDEIEKLKTIDDAIDYIEDMSENKKQLVMKVFSRKMATRQWQTIAAERY